MSKQMVSNPVARVSDPVTSDWAGENDTARAASQRAVLAILSDAVVPLSDWQIFQEYSRRDIGQLTQQRLRTARKELQDAGVVDAAGVEYGASPTRGRAQTWKRVQS